MSDETLDALDRENFDIVLISKPECLSCSHLIKQVSVKTKEYDCYEEKNCPAKTFNVTLGVDLLRYSNALAKAWASNNTDRIIRIATRLRKLHPAVQTKVHQLAKTKLRDL